MAKVDLDKLICSLINEDVAKLRIDPKAAIYDALRAQGLSYKDGAFVEIEPKSLKAEPRGKQTAAWSKDDEQYLLVCKNALAKYQITDKWDASIISRWLEDRLKSIRLHSQCGSEIPSKEYILNVWELGNQWEAITNGICNTEHGTQLNYIQKHWKEGDYYAKIAPQNRWKPSDMELEALRLVAEKDGTCLMGLYENLKKLKA